MGIPTKSAPPSFSSPILETLPPPQSSFYCTELFFSVGPFRGDASMGFLPRRLPRSALFFSVWGYCPFFPPPFKTSSSHRESPPLTFEGHVPFFWSSSSVCSFFPRMLSSPMSPPSFRFESRRNADFLPPLNLPLFPPPASLLRARSSSTSPPFFLASPSVCFQTKSPLFSFPSFSIHLGVPFSGIYPPFPKTYPLGDTYAPLFLQGSVLLKLARRHEFLYRRRPPFSCPFLTLDVTHSDSSRRQRGLSRFSLFL